MSTEYHVGYPLTDREIVEKVRQGLPVYVPTSPVMTDQTANIAFAAKVQGRPR